LGIQGPRLEKLKIIEFHLNCFGKGFKRSKDESNRKVLNGLEGGGEEEMRVEMM